ncbi:DUF4382 domain-containing protein [Ascidiimonas sp. W6]|uniref:DUF4382 domain-containing protein n=1 Tax=Ascidiimonas meishanensis TaxID=3128903 RepID=UPI0030EEB5E5
MKKQVKSLSIFCAFVLCIFLIQSCSDEDSGVTGSTANISVRLTDAPGDFEAVNIDIQDVLIQRTDEANDKTTWESIGNINAGVYDLLELTGGINVVLADNEVPAGAIKQIRLLLGENNTVLMEGTEYALKTPSGQQAGLKLQVNETLEPGFSYDFLIDFDVDKSIVVAGNSGNINLKPVLRVTTKTTTGILMGSVNITDFQVVASVSVGEETISAYADNEGNFVLFGIPEGTYTLTLTPEEASQLLPKVIDGIEITNGETTDVGLITLD